MDSLGERIVTLSPGSRLGPYEILGQIGAGGMGEVLAILPEVVAEEQPLTVVVSAVEETSKR